MFNGRFVVFILGIGVSDSVALAILGLAIGLLLIHYSLLHFSVAVLHKLIAMTEFMSRFKKRSMGVFR